MHIAFAIVKYQPYGGSQRDCLALAKHLVSRGHEVTIFTTEWRGNGPGNIVVEILPVRAFTNHGLNKRFSRALAVRVAQEAFDGVVGFNKLGGLDIYYVADICLALSVRGVKRILPRYRTLLDMEAQVFGKNSDTFHLFLTKTQLDLYASVYGDADHGSVVLPPLLDPARKIPADTGAARRRIRDEIEISQDAMLIVNIATQYSTKGVDRILDLLVQLENVYFLSVGLGESKKLKSGINRLKLQNRVKIFGHRDDIVDILCAADLMVHPARKENTGGVILESLMCGTPVVCSAACGNAVFVEESGAGIVTPEPFELAALTDAVTTCLSMSRLERLRDAALAFSGEPTRFQGRERAAEAIIVELKRRKGKRASHS